MRFIGTKLCNFRRFHHPLTLLSWPPLLRWEKHLLGLGELLKLKVDSYLCLDSLIVLLMGQKCLRQTPLRLADQQVEALACHFSALTFQYWSTISSCRDFFLFQMAYFSVSFFLTLLWDQQFLHSVHQLQCRHIHQRYFWSLLYSLAPKVSNSISFSQGLIPFFLCGPQISWISYRLTFTERRCQQTILPQG